MAPAILIRGTKTGQVKHLYMGALRYGAGFTMIIPFIQPGWRVQSYWYVPGVDRVREKVSPLFSVFESKVFEPLGTAVEVTVWGMGSS